jgi:hypothetical protein
MLLFICDNKKSSNISMNSLAILQRTALIILATSWALNAKALPFRNTPKDFEIFFNQVWQKGRAGDVVAGMGLRSDDPNEGRRYFGFHSCKWTQPQNNVTWEEVRCGAYVDIVTPMESNRCKVQVWYSHSKNDVNGLILEGNPWLKTAGMTAWGQKWEICKPN